MNSDKQIHQARLARAELMAAKAAHAGLHRAAQQWRNEFIRLAVEGGWPDKEESK